MAPLTLRDELTAIRARLRELHREHGAHTSWLGIAANELADAMKELPRAVLAQRLPDAPAALEARRPAARAGDLAPIVEKHFGRPDGGGAAGKPPVSVPPREVPPPPVARKAPTLVTPPPALDLSSPDPEPTAAQARLRRKLRVIDGRVRAKTVSGDRLTREERQTGADIEYPEGVVRPRMRSDCSDMDRPCPFVSCAHHLYLDVNPETGTLKLNFPHLEVWEMAETCSLDVADRGGITLEELGAIMNLTRERIRQVEVRGLAKIKDHGGDELGMPPERPEAATG